MASSYSFTLMIWTAALPMQGDVWTLVLRASLFSKTVLTSLLVISIICWAITLSKYWHYRGCHDNYLRAIDSLRPKAEVAAVYNRVVKDIGGAVGRIFEEGYLTLVSYTDGTIARGRPGEGNNPNPALSPEKDVSLRLQAATDSELANLATGLTFLATAVTISPFLGLLGTVWGVMYTFLSIGQAGNAELTVVAPGIAEALITTVAGLLVAIPALMCNNFLVARLERLEDDFARYLTELNIYFGNVWHREKTKAENRLGHQRDFAR